MVDLEVPVWREDGFDQVVVHDPSATEVADALRLLNGAERNDLYLRSGAGQWMGFGGGPGRVIVTYADDFEGPFSEAVGDLAPTETVTVFVGGQDVRLPAKKLIRVEDATVAAVAFLQTEQRPESLVWESLRPCRYGAG